MASEAAPTSNPTDPHYDANEAEAVYQEFMEEDTPNSPNPDIELFGVVLRAFVQMLKQMHGKGSNPREQFLASRRLSKSSVLSVLINSEVHGKPYRRQLFKTRKFRRIICTARVMNELSKFSKTPRNEDLVSILSSVYKEFSSSSKDNAVAQTLSSNAVAETSSINAVADTPTNNSVAEFQNYNAVAETLSNNPYAETSSNNAVAETSRNNAVVETPSIDADEITLYNSAVVKTLSK